MTRRKKRKEKQNTNSEEPKLTAGEIFKKYSEIIKIIAGILIVLYPIANYVYEFMYQINCERFYGIPGKYFSANINSRLLYLALIILLIILFFLPSFLRNYEKRQEKDTMSSRLYYIFLSIVLGLEMGLINLQNLIQIMQVTNDQNVVFRYINNWIDRHAYLVLITVVIMGALSLLGIVLVPEIKRKWIKKVVTYISVISFAASGILIFYGTVFKLGTSIEDKTKYEVVTNQDKKYVVLTEEDDKILVVEYAVVDGKYIFDTNQYAFLDRYECKFSYINTGIKPNIDNENIKNN